MKAELAGKSALVTGSTHNLGRVIALEFARRGARVVVHGKTGARQVADTIAAEVPGSRPLAVSFDLADRAAIHAGFADLAADGVDLDVLVNNAAHLGLEETPGLDSSPELFRDVLEVNVFGTHLCSVLAARAMAARGGGAIVNISSLAGQRAIHGRLSYNTSKAAIDGMTRAMAIDFARHGIRVNAIAPGYVWSDRWERIDDAEAARRRARIPVAEPTSQGEIAALAAFLASDRARTLTGSVIPIDGGLAAQQSPWEPADD
ncbi:MAG: SDR family oxidoreductase [Propionicimonas sp.]|nr:SDR family oxidoreductase [Propionicimonas sp.]